MAGAASANEMRAARRHHRRIQALARTHCRRTRDHFMIIAMGLYQGFTALDAIGPYEVLTYLPDAQVVICAEHAGLVDDQYGLVHLRVDTTFADVPRPEVLFVPGGPVA